MITEMNRVHLILFGITIGYLDPGGSLVACAIHAHSHAAHALHFPQEKYALKLPPYPGQSQCVRLGVGSGQIDPATIRAPVFDAPLLESDAARDPMEQFGRWFSEAVRSGRSREPTAMALATADDDGVPSVRMVLLKVRERTSRWTDRLCWEAEGKATSDGWEDGQTDRRAGDTLRSRVAAMHVDLLCAHV
jgi:Pyridoxamine 5'-phosphate oxidase